MLCMIISRLCSQIYDLTMLIVGDVHIERKKVTTKRKPFQSLMAGRFYNNDWY